MRGRHHGASLDFVQTGPAAGPMRLSTITLGALGLVEVELHAPYVVFMSLHPTSVLSSGSDASCCLERHAARAGRVGAARCRRAVLAARSTARQSHVSRDCRRRPCATSDGSTAIVGCCRRCVSSWLCRSERCTTVQDVRRLQSRCLCRAASTEPCSREVDRCQSRDGDHCIDCEELRILPSRALPGRLTRGVRRDAVTNASWVPPDCCRICILPRYRGWKLR